MKNVIQIAGVKDFAEAQLLLSSGVDYLGFPLYLTHYQPDLTANEAAQIIKALACGTKSVLITYQNNARAIADLGQFLGVHQVQLHGDIKVTELQCLRKIAPALKIIKSLIVRQDNQTELFHTVDLFSDLVDVFITDTFDPATGASGATGKTHDWIISRQIVEYSPRPVILAGGLTPDNVREAILTVQPAGVDTHTGLEDSRGRKDPQLVSMFVLRARQAFAEIAAAAEPVVELPIDGILDLHTFAPREVKDLIPEYLTACRAKSIYTVRIIHGKGTGALRETVHALLKKLPYVAEFRLADETGGSWGATIVYLLPDSSSIQSR